MSIQKNNIISLVKSLKLDDEIKNKKIVVIQRQILKIEKLAHRNRYYVMWNKMLSTIKRVVKQILGESTGCLLQAEEIGGGVGRFKRQIKRNEYIFKHDKKKKWKNKFPNRSSQRKKETKE